MIACLECREGISSLVQGVAAAEASATGAPSCIGRAAEIDGRGAESPTDSSVNSLSHLFMDLFMDACMDPFADETAHDTAHEIADVTTDSTRDASIAASIAAAIDANTDATMALIVDRITDARDRPHRGRARKTGAAGQGRRDFDSGRGEPAAGGPTRAPGTRDHTAPNGCGSGGGRDGSSGEDRGDGGGDGRGDGRGDDDGHRPHPWFASALVHRDAPAPERHAPEIGAEAVQAVLARKTRERDERIDAIYAAMRARDPRAERFAATLFHDFEHAPFTTNAEQLAAIGVQVPAPGATPVSDEAAADALWRIVYGLAHLGIYLVNTDHLSDRRLLEMLAGRILRDGVRDSGGCADMSEFIDLHHCPPEEHAAQAFDRNASLLDSRAPSGPAIDGAKDRADDPGDAGHASKGSAIGASIARDGNDGARERVAAIVDHPDGLTGPFEHADEDDDESAPWDQGRARAASGCPMADGSFAAAAPAGVERVVDAAVDGALVAASDAASDAASHAAVEVPIEAAVEVPAASGHESLVAPGPRAVRRRDHLLPLPRMGRPR